MRWDRLAGIVLGIQMLMPAWQAGAMSAPRAVRHANCTVVGAEKLPAEAGGAEALCAAIQRAVATGAPGVRFTVEVKVVSNSRLAAALVVNGKALPQQNFAIMDRTLDQKSIRRFANAIATKVAAASKA